MAKGKTIVTVPLGSIPEMVGINRGLLLKDLDYEHMADAMIELLTDDKKTLRIGISAREFICE